jgi:hypothetical protein
MSSFGAYIRPAEDEAVLRPTDKKITAEFKNTSAVFLCSVFEL